MKVLFVAHSYPRFPRDPVGSFILRLAVALRARDVDVLVIAPAGPGLAATDTYEGIPVRRFRYAPAKRQTLAYTGTMAVQARGSWMGRLSLAGLPGAGVLAPRGAAGPRVSGGHDAARLGSQSGEGRQLRAPALSRRRPALRGVDHGVGVARPRGPAPGTGAHPAGRADAGRGGAVPSRRSGGGGPHPCSGGGA